MAETQHVNSNMKAEHAALDVGALHPLSLQRLVCDVLEEKGATDILCFNLVGKSDIADYMVVATGNVARHVDALAEHVAVRCKEEDYPVLAIEGRPPCDWVLVDLGDVVVHIFRPEVRDMYQLEKIWGGDFAS